MTRQAAWFVGNSIANVIGGVIAYGIGHIHSTSLLSWQLIFLILGAITSGYAVLLFFFLPDSPANAVFLRKNERAIALHRTLENKTGVLDAGKFQKRQVWLALKDPQAWLLVVYTFCVNLCNGGVTTVSPLLNIRIRKYMYHLAADATSSPPFSLRDLATLLLRSFSY
jgi:MFS family permease